MLVDGHAKCSIAFQYNAPPFRPVHIDKIAQRNFVKTKICLDSAKNVPEIFMTCPKFLAGG